MTPTLLHAVARKAEAQTPDADLLARFARDRDNPSFEELVRRHGPLVWAVCRHMLPDHADAEDAFQAVFLALVRSAATIRDGRTVPAWLHGVAVRVAVRVRRGCARRRTRERRAATPEADRPVSDGAWEALLAAVHEEVQRLPDAERTAFVLCDLEGVSQPDAAARLGWPLGSLSGRLCRARQRLVDRLSARGVAPAAAVGIGLTAGVASAVPANLFEVVKFFPASPATASTAAAVLARGLTEGIAMKLKLVTAALVVAAGFGLTGGAVWLSKADAQPPEVVKETKDLLKSLGDGQPPRGEPVAPPAAGGGGGFGGPGLAPGAADPFGQPPRGLPPAAGASAGIAAMTWEYKFVDAKSDRKAFEATITQHGKEGWEYSGSERFGDGNKAEFVLVFKKPKGGTFGGGFSGMGQGPLAGAAGGFGGTTGGGGRAGNTPPAQGGRGAGENAFQVFKLKYAKAEEVVAVVNEMYANKGVRVIAETTSNSVIVLALPATVKDIDKVIAELDAKAVRPGAPAGTTPAPKPATGLTVIPLKHAVAEDLEEGLKHFFPTAEIVVEPRTNQLIVRADAKTLEELQALIGKLDVPVSKPK